MRIRTLNDVMQSVEFSTLREWENIKKELIASIRFASSIDLIKQDLPLNTMIFDAVDYGDFVTEKVIFRSFPGFYVTGNLYRPKDTSKKYPAIVNPHGHWDNGRLDMEDITKIPLRCANFAKRGIVAFSYDMIGFCDSTQLPHDNMLFKEAEAYNFSSFTLQTNNSIKAVDFISSLPYVDTERIGCTGCSGGGTQTYFLTALDERIKVAAPINMASFYMQGGCTCENCAFLRTEFCNVDYTMTIAPRPLFMSAADGDWTLHSVEEEFPSVERLYALYGVPENYEHFFQHAPHCYNKATREKVYSFFCRHFGIENVSEKEIEINIDVETLRIGDISKYIKDDEFIESDRELFAKAEPLIQKHLSGLTADEKENLKNRVFVLGKSFELDIPYVVDEQKFHEIKLGKCPHNTDFGNVLYYHCYNYADDTKRVNAIIRLAEKYPNLTISATGKSAALCEIASKLTKMNTKLVNADYCDIHIPGFKLVF